MASVLARVSRRTCRDLLRTLQIARPTAIVQRSFLTSSFNVQRVSHPSFGAQRFESALATARQGQLVGDEVEETTSKEELPHFMTLEGSISPLTLKALTQTPMKLTHMSPVQATVFPLLPQLAEPYDSFPSDNAARDLLVKARTGTGKTLGFLLPAVEARLKAIEAHGKQAVLDAGLKSDKTLEMRAQRAYAHKNLGALIISPTRELATQIAVEAQKLTSHIEGFTVNLFVGGAPKGPQMRGWTRGRRDILVATPGRLRDFLVSEPEVASGLAKTQVFILDEADTLLDMGFRPDIDAIGDSLPPTPERQTFLFSATVSKGVEQIAKRMLAPNHRFINCVPADSSPVHAHVPQYHTVLQNASLQIPHIVRLLAHDQLVNPGASKVILFLPTTKMTQLFATAIRELAKNSLPAGRNTSIYEIHSKRTMDARTSTSNRFRSDKSGASILITSDVSARGVDYPNVTRVIQVGIPSSPDQYIHRVGRTGRAGTKGRGDLVLLPFELQYLTTALSHLPLVPLRHNSLTEETLVLAKKFDEDPQAFFANAPWTSSTAPRIGPSRDRRLPVTGPSMFQTPLVGTLEALENNVTQLVSRFDEDGVNETFLSLIGYYASQSIDMRITRESLVEGLKAWTVDACGLPMPPFISPSFLQKIGLADSTGRDARGRRHTRDPRSSMRDTRRRESKDFAYGTKDEKESQRADWGEDGFGPDRGRYSQGSRGGYGQDGRGGYSQGSRGGYGQGSRGGYSQRGRGGYQRSRGDGQDGRGGYREGGRGGYGEGGRGDGQGSRHRDAGESGYGLKR